MLSKIILKNYCKFLVGVAKVRLRNVSKIGLIGRVKRILKHPIYFSPPSAAKEFKILKIRKFNKRVAHPYTHSRKHKRDAAKVISL